MQIGGVCVSKTEMSWEGSPVLKLFGLLSSYDTEQIQDTRLLLIISQGVHLTLWPQEKPPPLWRKK